MADAASAGIADVGGITAHPSCKSIGNGAQVPAAAGDQGGTERERHFGVIGHTPWFQMQPAATDDVLVDFVLRGDLVRRHEFDGGTQRIANGQTEE